MPIYEGTENYIFISYAHKDSDTVLPMINHMQEQGFRVWFDSGVEAGTEWPEYIAEHLENAAVVLVLMSNAATASRNCRDEINFALDMGKDMLVVHLEEAKLTAGMRLRLSAIQAMFRYRSKTEEGFLEELCKTKLLQCCRVRVTPSPAAVEIEEEVAAAPVTPPPVAPKPEETPDELCARGDRCYAEGNYEEAANCYRKAAGLGHGDALAGLARCYYNGNGVAQDHDEAFDLYAEAAEKGSARGMYGLGNCYYDGKGAKKDFTRAFNYYRVAAERGDTMAMNKLAICFATGNGVKENQEEAVRYFRMAAEKDDLNGQYNYGLRLLKGHGVPQDREEGIRWLTIAAGRGHTKAKSALEDTDYEESVTPVEEITDADALYQQGLRHYRSKEYSQAVECYKKAMELGSQDAAAGLGACLYHGYGIAEDKDQALDLFITAAQKGSAAGQNGLGFCYYDGKIVTKSPARAATWYRKAADQGHAQATCNLGLLYYKGDGVPQDYSTAVECFRKSADLGYAGGMYQLGLCYERGHGVIADAATAASWIRKAADLGHEKAKKHLGGGASSTPTETAQQLYDKGEQAYADGKYSEAVSYYTTAASRGHGDAKAALGRCYYNGRGVAIDYHQAFRLYTEAADLGSGRGFAGLGNCYYDGHGVTRDYGQSVEYYRKAVALGNSSAMTNLGYCYAHGQGVSEDHAEAARYYQMGARKGSTQSMFNLGLCYLNGSGVRKDEDLALSWFRQAAEKGHEKAKGKVQEIEEARKKKAASNLPEGFEIRDSRGNTVDLMEYMMSLSKEAGKRRYECPKCKVGLWSTDYHNSEPCPKCGTMIPKR